MKIYHTSPKEITEIVTSSDSYVLGTSLCFSDDVYQMAACDVLVYSVEIDEEEIIDARSFFYQENYEVLNDLVKDIMNMYEVDEDTAQELLSLRVQPENDDDGQISWKLQGMSGTAAKLLGFIAARSQDEQGTVYIIDMLDRNLNILERE